MDTPDAAPRPRVGRPVDRSSDAAILSAALDLVAERDYERMTLDEVAARTGKAKTTIYRRWATKEDLVLAAIRAAGGPPEAAALPDTGSLRGDLVAVVDSAWLGGPDRRTALFAGLAPAMRGSERLAAAIRAEVTEPYVAVYGRLLARAIERGEVGARPSDGRRRARRGRPRDEHAPPRRRPRARAARRLPRGDRPRAAAGARGPLTRRRDGRIPSTACRSAPPSTPTGP
ncbi:TetR/AcrR family transcriptional regulator [Clavibacter zhangzhiyongii]|uniref:TetR/AcrR family transcriptional regulator n=1 Tax=Clavibacter zhangzhiyongii TaxID=2768071 RepID=UPI0039E168B5